MQMLRNSLQGYLALFLVVRGQSVQICTMQLLYTPTTFHTLCFIKEASKMIVYGHYLCDVRKGELRDNLICRGDE